MSEELKPCPFCGSGNLDISIKVSSKTSKKSSYHSAVYCKLCNTYGPRTIIKFDHSNYVCRHLVEDEILGDKKSIVIDAWNTRNTPNKEDE